MVRYNPEFRQNEDQIGKILVPASDGAMIPVTVSYTHLSAYSRAYKSKLGRKQKSCRLSRRPDNARQCREAGINT